MTNIEVKSNLTFKRVLLIVTTLLLVVTFVLGITVSFFGTPTLFAGTRPDNLGIYSGQLAPCPTSPNCVNSHSDALHQIEPLTYKSSATTAFANLKTVIESFKQAKIIKAPDNYLYAEFTIPVVGFVDDVEFLLEPDGIIHVRSASRLGESDLGVNRKRIETIRAKLNQIEDNSV